MVSDDVRSVAAVLEGMTHGLQDDDKIALILLACRNLASLAEQVGMLEGMTPQPGRAA
ncbi:MAG: hypothetical protein PUB01_00410 [Desulfovibrionaceae bacterium]|nr:hypothetical protein [Desulfovibrionaceae bacterium]